MIKVKQFSCGYDSIKECVEAFANEGNREIITCSIIPGAYERGLERHSFDEKWVYVIIVYKEVQNENSQV